MNKTNTFFNCSEHFFSIQGEGDTVGVPAYFVRLQSCNLCSIGIKPGRHEPRVWTPSGKKRLSQIKEDDIVYGVNEESGQLVETKVKAVFNYKIGDHIELKIEGVPTLYVSYEHPFLTKRGWIKAKDLQEGEEVFHIEKRDFHSAMKTGDRNPMKRREVAEKSTRNTDYKDIGRKVSRTRKLLFAQNKLKTPIDILRERGEFDDWRDRASKRMKESNPMHNPETVQKSQGMHSRTIDGIYHSNTEKKFHELCKKAGFPVDYIGNFQLPVKVPGTNGYIYPDFIIRGTNRIIETFWSKGRHEKRDDKWQQARREIFEANGYDVTFVDFSALNQTDIADLLSTEFQAVNGLKIEKIKVIKQDVGFASLKRRDLHCIDLTCFPHHTFIVDGIVTHNCGGKNAELLKAGKATWYCDTETVWRKGSKLPFENLYDEWCESGIINRILDGNIHIIWTGGEPTLPKHRKAIVAFNKWIWDRHPQAQFTMYQEIETNGTLDWNEPEGLYFCENNTSGVIKQINCSPKLSNSGELEELRINPRAIRHIQRHPNHFFKFVISTEDDLKEAIDTYITPFHISSDLVILMPGVDCLEDLPERSRFIFEMTKKYGYRSISRQHILGWNKTTGV